MTASRDDRKIVHVAVGVLVRTDGHVLLCDRPAGKPYAGYWEFPGGKIEAQESVATALARELHEELGIDIGAASAWVVFEHDYPHAYVRLHFCRVFEWHGEPHGREGQRIGFFDPMQPLPAPLLPAAVPALRWISLPSVYAQSDIAAMGVDLFLAAFDRALSQGLRMLVIREPDIEESLLPDIVQAAVLRARGYDARILVSSRHSRASWGIADGVHLTARDLMQATRRPEASWVAASVHERDELAHAARIGCDFAIIGPLRSTSSEPGQKNVNWSGFAQLCHENAIPVYAAGELDRDELEGARHAGAHGVALKLSAWSR